MDAVRSLTLEGQIPAGYGFKMTREQGDTMFKVMLSKDGLDQALGHGVTFHDAIRDANRFLELRGKV